MPGIISLFIMCIGIIRNNSLVDGRSRAESNPATERVTLYCTWRLSALTIRPRKQVAPTRYVGLNILALHRNQFSQLQFHCFHFTHQPNIGLSTNTQNILQITSKVPSTLLWSTFILAVAGLVTNSKDSENKQEILSKTMPMIDNKSTRNSTAGHHRKCCQYSKK